MAGRIEWVAGPYSDRGLVGGLDFFSVSWGTTRGDKLPWKLDSRLPISFKFAGGAEKDDAKQAAETVLAAFVERIGATFPEG